MGTDPAQSSIALQLLLIATLTLINAYFAANEMAAVSVNKNRTHRKVEEGNHKAMLVEKLPQELTSFLSTIQVTITLAGFFNSASAVTGVSVCLGTVLEAQVIPYGEMISMVVVTILLSSVTLIFGELVPKRAAPQNVEVCSMFCARPILIISRIVSPSIKILS